MSTENAKISYGLWFNGNAAEAIDFYKTVFNKVTINEQADYAKAGQEKHGMEPGKLMFVNFTLEDVAFQAINAGDEFKKNPSISFFINCKTPEEAEEYWDKLVEGGKVLMPLNAYDWSPKYGWLQDKFDVSWQIYTSRNESDPINQKINASLMFINEAHGRAEEAVNFYASVFKNSEIQGIMKYPAGSDDEGMVMHSQFLINGHTLMAMDSGMNHQFNFNSGVSLVVNCTTQDEIDYFWNKLTEGGKEVECGWLEDKFGVSWQVSPLQLDKMMADDDSEAVARVTEEMMRQKKLDIAKLEKAFEGK